MHTKTPQTSDGAVSDSAVSRLRAVGVVCVTLLLIFSIVSVTDTLFGKTSRPSDHIFQNAQTVSLPGSTATISE